MAVQFLFDITESLFIISPILFVEARGGLLWQRILALIGHPTCAIVSLWSQAQRAAWGAASPWPWAKPARRCTARGGAHEASLALHATESGLRLQQERRRSRRPTMPAA